MEVDGCAISASRDRFRTVLVSIFMIHSIRYSTLDKIETHEVAISRFCARFLNTQIIITTIKLNAERVPAK